ncbi:NAD(P)/FAD-dependent oxidoreductase [Mycobacterium syngnathidarum]
MSIATNQSGMRATDVDAVVVGAGFNGIRMMIELEKIGLSATLLEAGSAVGGTWHWNRYPGARTDSLSWTYAYRFDKELREDWDWPHNYPERATVQAYLTEVVRRHGLESRIRLNTAVAGASYDTESNTWTVTTSSGTTVTCTYFITCSGPLSAPIEPDFVDRDTFKGQIVFTARWPEEGLDLVGKRVALVGTGASGVQALPHLAEAAEHVTVFQRTPNYVMPAVYYELSDSDRAQFRRDFDKVLERQNRHPWGFDMTLSGRTYDSVTEEERQAIFEENWCKGGFFFLFEAFDDYAQDERSNDAAAAFVRKKIRETVKDPEVAELLCPDYPLMARRPPVGSGYYEAFNRSNVTLVDISDDKLVGMTPQGLTTASGAEYEADVIIIAAGFDAATGSLTRMDVRGADGRSLRETFALGVETYLGIGVNGFPNLLMVGGPQAAGGNYPFVGEYIVEFIGELIAHARDTGQPTIEVTPESTVAWTEHLDEVVNATILKEAFKKAGAYAYGANVADKPFQSLFYAGGLQAYRAKLQQERESDFSNFQSVTSVASRR